MIKVTGVIVKETKDLEEKVTAELYQENPIDEEEVIKNNEISLPKGENGSKDSRNNSKSC